MSLFEAKCPLCDGTLWIDPSNMKIVDHKPSEQSKADLDGFLKSYRQDKGWDSKMKKAKEEEARRKAEIEQLFKKAKDDKESNDTSSTGPKSLLDWD